MGLAHARPNNRKFSRQVHDSQCPYNFLHRNGNPAGNSACIWMSKKSKMLPRLSKCVGRCQHKNAMSKGSICSCSDDRLVNHRLQKISVVCLMLIRQNRSIFCWVTRSAARRHSAWLPQLISNKFFGGRNFCRNKFRKLAFDHGATVTKLPDAKPLHLGQTSLVRQFGVRGHFHPFRPLALS